MTNKFIDSLHELCLKNNWTATSSQLDKTIGFATGLFKNADREQTVRRLADVIWICTENADITVIHRDLYEWYDEMKKEN